MPHEKHAELDRLEAEMNALIAQTSDLERKIEGLKSTSLEIREPDPELIHGADVVPPPEKFSNPQRVTQ